MNNPDHISLLSWVKVLKFFDADRGSGMEKIRIRDGINLDMDPGWKKEGSEINITDPQHCLCDVKRKKLARRDTVR